MADSQTDYALLSTIEQELLVREAENWGDALAQYLDKVDLDPETFLGCLDQTPQEHYTVDLYAADGREETVIVMELERLEVEEPHTLEVE